MTHIVMALILFGLAGWIGSLASDGYRTGTIQFIWLGGLNPLVFDRLRSPAWFWGALAINGALGAGFALAGILMVVVGRG